MSLMLDDRLGGSLLQTQQLTLLGFMVTSMMSRIADSLVGVTAYSPISRSWTAQYSSYRIMANRVLLFLVLLLNRTSLGCKLLVCQTECRRLSSKRICWSPFCR